MLVAAAIAAVVGEHRAAGFARQPILRRFQQQAVGKTRRRSAYDHAAIEERWQTYWEEHETYKAVRREDRAKKYVLDMFPYPSGSGLHVGHPAGYTASDVMARYWRARGFDVLHPMGWDAFGLPAEQHAIQTGTHPRETTKANIENFKRQLKALGFSYDWARELATTDVDYVKWTQWIFLRLFEKGLAEQREVAVNWCPALGTVLANEEVIDGKSERGGFPVERQPLRQWVLKITEYADALLAGLDGLDWPSGTLRSQREWIGRSEGATVLFDRADGGGSIEVFTTRPDTLAGATYVVLAPEHPMAHELCEDTDALETYLEEVRSKSDLERQTAAKTGLPTGSLAVHPLSGETLPIWIADYVVGGYGTGAVMAVPAHDERDYAFATAFDLPVKAVVDAGSTTSELPVVDPGVCVNSGEALDGLETEACKRKVVELLEASGKGGAKVTYKLRDWIFSRQRYWGEPIPIYFPVCGLDGSPLETDPRDGRETDDFIVRYDQPIPVDDADLPLELPEMDDFRPGDDPRGCLARAADWRFFERDGTWFARETNTMPQWAGSCWYYLRFADPSNEAAAIAPEADRAWLPVDLYVGGAEHAVLHLLYARFWHKVLYDLGVVESSEPFAKLVHQGMILGADGEKMSKSRGNVVNPDDVVDKAGADALRLYEMFMGPLEAVKPWQTDQVAGVVRFRDKCYAVSSRAADVECDRETLVALHKTMRKVTQDIEQLGFNTAISALMVFVNRLASLDEVPRLAVDRLAVMLSPFAPHLAEEIWSTLLANEPSVSHQPWVVFDPDLCVDETVTVAVQVNGKVRAKLDLAPDESEDAARHAALAEPAVAKFADGKEIKKFIYVPGRIINLVLAK
mmetsp:Transcript_8919/g.28303  ORF Transcript_8919/g.28303 Transcript_8919/m.28303 type:complete len:859 (-) Transcript_8919:181-2757(-)